MARALDDRHRNPGRCGGPACDSRSHVLPVLEPQARRQLEPAGRDSAIPRLSRARVVGRRHLGFSLTAGAPAQVTRNDLQECLHNFGKPGYEVGMLGNFYSIVASELGDRDLAYKLFLSMLRSYAKPPFYAMSETPGNNRFVFLTAEGAFLQLVIFGFTGLRFSHEELTRKYQPLLPPAWQSLELRGVNVKGKRYDIRVGQDGGLSMAAAHP